MPKGRVLECVFLIPLRRDAEISDGELHSTDEWQWLQTALIEQFTGWTMVPSVQGAWKSAQTGKTIADQSHQFTVAVPGKRLSRLRSSCELPVRCSRSNAFT
jgi:hypothetical protein